MLEIILNLCEVTAIAIIGFLIRKYVFLEPSLQPKKQRIFYIISIAVIALGFVLFGKDAAEIICLGLIGLNTFLARKQSRFIGLLLMIPFPGIINGLLIPILRLPPYIFSFSERGAAIWQISFYGIVFVLLAVFYFAGGKWRMWFDDNAQGRELRSGEKILLCVIGILMLIFSDPNDISLQTISNIVMTITIIVLIMQGNKRTYYHKQFSEMQFNIITMMADIVENRDDNTGGHIKRTAKYVGVIADELKKEGKYSDILTEKYISDMTVAAPLHDIGKIHISDTILNKPGRLIDEEFEIMKTHTTAGEKLLIHAKDELGESSYLDMAVEMAAYHHEWWNGCGYPYKIKENEIPLCARIMAVADVFDALTAKRCYKNAMPIEKAVSIIREETGTHFDPIVSEAFLSAVDKIDLS